jgi:hypothetical protein
MNVTPCSNYWCPQHGKPLLRRKDLAQIRRSFLGVIDVEAERSLYQNSSQRMVRGSAGCGDIGPGRAG